MNSKTQLFCFAFLFPKDQA